MKHDKSKCLKFYLDSNSIGLLEFSQITGISLEDLEGILQHTTLVTESMSLSLAKYTDIKNPKFWTDSKENY